MNLLGMFSPILKGVDSGSLIHAFRFVGPHHIRYTSVLPS